MSSNDWFTFMVKKPKLFVPVEDLLPVLSYRCFAQVKLGTTVRGLPKPKSTVTVQRAKTKEAPGELGSMGLPLLCGEEAAFSGGTKQLPQTAVGSLMGEVIPEDTWEIGSISPKARTERALSWLLCPRKPQMSPSHSGLRQLSPRAWHSHNEEPSGAL